MFWNCTKIKRRKNKKTLEKEEKERELKKIERELKEKEENERRKKTFDNNYVNTKRLNYINEIA